MKIGKRDQKKIDKELVQFFSYFNLGKRGDMLYDAFKEYIAKRNMQVILNEEKAR